MTRKLNNSTTFLKMKLTLKNDKSVTLSLDSGN